MSTPIFRRTACLLGIALSSLSALHAQNNGFAKERLLRIDSMVTKHIQAQHIPGAVVLLWHNGKPVYHKAFGYADVDSKKNMQTDAIFRIASQTKAVTSLAVMLLWEEGKFLLDDPVSLYIPEFKSPKVLVSFNASDSSYTTRPASKEISIRELLTHTSGLDYAAIGSNEFKAIYYKAGVPVGVVTGGQAKLGDKMKILGKLPLKHDPGEAFTYGLNTDVLGYLVEVLSGQSLDEFFRKRIFEPLGMKDTYFYLPSGKQGRLATLYENKDDKLVKVTHPIFDGADPLYPNTNSGYYSGGAGLSSTAEDYAKFLQLFLNGGVYNGKRIIGRKTIELMLTNQLGMNRKASENGSAFGLGFGLETPVNDYRSPVSVGSFSWGGAFNTQYWADPKEQIVGLIMTQGYYSPWGRIGEEFKGLVYQALE
jgi:CubicO group peptidase (beta-lactamase class C family)